MDFHFHKRGILPSYTRKISSFLPSYFAGENVSRQTTEKGGRAKIVIILLPIMDPLLGQTHPN